MRSFNRRGISVLFFSIIFSLEVGASSLIRSSTRELSSKSSWVGRVRIESSQSEKRQIPYEVFQAKILEVFKGRGEPGQVIVFSRPGGHSGKRSVAVMGAPVLNQGKDYVVFLEEDPLFQFRDQRLEVQLESWTAYEVVPGREGQGAQVVRPGSIIPSRASRAYQRSASLGYGSVAVGSYEDLVTEIFRGLD